MCQGRTVAAAVPRTAHGISIAALLPPAAVEAARWRVMRAVAVASHAALLIVAARVHLQEKQSLKEARCEYLDVALENGRCKNNSCLGSDEVVLLKVHLKQTGALTQ